MKTYSDLIKHTYGLLPEEFEVINAELYFQGIRLLDYIEKYEAPLKLSYLPNIAENIAKAHQWFNYAFEINQYSGSYTYAFCTKASHFKFTSRLLRNFSQAVILPNKRILSVMALKDPDISIALSS